MPGALRLLQCCVGAGPSSSSSEEEEAAASPGLIDLPPELIRKVALLGSVSDLLRLWASCTYLSRVLDDTTWEHSVERAARTAEQTLLNCPWGASAPRQLRRLCPQIEHPRFRNLTMTCVPSIIRANPHVLTGATPTFFGACVRAT